MIVNRDETVDRLVRLMSNGNVKVITGRLSSQGIIRIHGQTKMASSMWE